MRKKSAKDRPERKPFSQQAILLCGSVCVRVRVSIIKYANSTPRALGSFAFLSLCCLRLPQSPCFKFARRRCCFSPPPAAGGGGGGAKRDWCCFCWASSRIARSSRSTRWREPFDFMAAVVSSGSSSPLRCATDTSSLADKISA